MHNSIVKKVDIYSMLFLFFNTVLLGIYRIIVTSVMRGSKQISSSSELMIQG